MNIICKLVSFMNIDVIPSALNKVTPMLLLFSPKILEIILPICLQISCLLMKLTNCLLVKLNLFCSLDNFFFLNPISNEEVALQTT